MSRALCNANSELIHILSELLLDILIQTVMPSTNQQAKNFPLKGPLVQN